MSLAMVQIAIRSPCLVSGQGRLLAVPQTIAKVDDEACRPRAESTCEHSRQSRPGSVAWLPGKPLHAACPGPEPSASSPRGPTFQSIGRNDMTLQLQSAEVVISPLRDAVQAHSLLESLPLGRFLSCTLSNQAGDPGRGAAPTASAIDHLVGAPWPLVGSSGSLPGWDFQWAPRLPRLFARPPESPPSLFSLHM